METEEKVDNGLQPMRIDDTQPRGFMSLFDTRDPTYIANVASNASWVVNWLLLVFKFVAVILSSSKAVAAALADSAVDLVSQFVLSMAERYMAKHNPDYPVGRSRLEALSVMACACIMSMASVEIIQYSVLDLYDGFTGHIPVLVVDSVLYSILGIGIFLKIVLYFYCSFVNKRVSSDILAALAEDHLNDVFSNLGAVGTAAIATNTSAWWMDPVGAILISFVIIYRYLSYFSSFEE
jgi:cation diffusion facilitator family transporter